jgi:dTDP-4-amino-4,6-dideoxygalactose transaminase
VRDPVARARSTMIPITKPSIGAQEARAAAAVIESGWVAQGPRVAAFERALADRVGARHAVAVSSGTGALHLGLLALDVGEGDEVLLPSLSYIATANAIRYTGATPVFVEVDARTFNVDPAAVERALSPRTRALLPVHQLGLPADLGAVTALAARHGLAVLEDAACALGAVYRGVPVGAGGGAERRCACFSFHPRKVITTGEGGAITTDDDVLAARLRGLRSHGVSVAADQRHSSTRVSDEAYLELGFNYRLTDIQAAVGLEQLCRLDELVVSRRALARRYAELLAPHSEITLPAVPEQCEHVFQSYMVLLAESLLARHPRRAIMQSMLDAGIATRRAVMAIHLEPLYAGASGGVGTLPITEAIARRGLMLPLYPGLTDAEQEQVVEGLVEACGF